MTEIAPVETSYRFIDDFSIEFYCSKSKYPEIKEDEKIYISGSFNGWISTADHSWQLTEKTDKNGEYFSLVKDFSQINIPGNSGFPEFIFYAISDESYHTLLSKDEPESYLFLKNKLILKNDDEISEIQKINKIPLEKTLKEFDLSNPSDRAALSNFRRVPATKNLYRGYHPFKKSRPQLDTEDARLDCVQKALAAYSVKTNICLSGYEFPNSSKGESMPIVFKAIEANGNFLFVNIDYNLVYYHSDASEYSNALRKICKFIIEHPGAFYINCRLGSDRTGAICAVIASLCGASWSDIAEDYEKTIRAGIGEYRNRKLLQYSIKNMTGTDPVDAGENLSEVMQDYFVKEKILTSSEIKKLVKKLNIEIKPEDSKYLDF